MSSESGKNVEEPMGTQSSEMADMNKRIDAMMHAIASLTAQVQKSQQTSAPPPPPGHPGPSTSTANPEPVATAPPPPVVDPAPPVNQQEPPPAVFQAPPPVAPPQPFMLEYFPEGGHPNVMHPGIDEALERRLEKIDNFMRQAQGKGKYGSIDYDDFCLFPEVQLPPNFKIPDFPKYDGTGDPVAHLRMFCNLLGNPTNDPRLAMRVFSQSLSGDALSWYLRLDPKSLHEWSDLADAFIKQYEFNKDLEPDRFTLMEIKKKPSELYRDYVKRWRAVAARITPPMSEAEMVKVFIDAQEAPYYERVSATIGKTFSEVIQQAEVVERGLKSGKIVDVSAIKVQVDSLQGGTAIGKKPFKKPSGKEEEAAFIIDQPNRTQGRFNRQSNYRPYTQTQTYTQPPSYTQPQSYPQPLPYAPPPAHPQPMLHGSPQPVYHAYTQPDPRPAYQGQRPRPLTHFRPTPPNPQPQPNQAQHNPVRQYRTFTNLGRPLDQVYEQLKAAGRIGTIPPPAFQKGVPENSGVSCAYHSGAPGHATANCWTLKHKIQDMIDAREIVIRQPEQRGPGVNAHPLPRHDAMVGMIDIWEDDETVMMIQPEGGQEPFYLDMEEAEKKKGKGEVQPSMVYPPLKVTFPKPAEVIQTEEAEGGDGIIEGIADLFVAVVQQSEGSGGEFSFIDPGHLQNWSSCALPTPREFR